MVFKTNDSKIAENIQKIQVDIAKIEEHLRGINGRVARTDGDLCKLGDKHTYDVKCIEDKLEKFSDNLTANKIELAKIAGVGGLAGISGGGGMMIIMRAMGV
jgi:hypothetical protein